MRRSTTNLLALATIIALAACAGDADDNGGMDMDDTAPAAGETGAQAPAPSTPQEPVNLPEGVTMEMVNQGRTLFRGQGTCLACHGPNAQGTQLGPDLTDDEWINVSGREMAALEEIIKTGVPQPKQHPGPMPAMGGANLSDAQVKALAAYVMTLGQG